MTTNALEKAPSSTKRGDENAQLQLVTFEVGNEEYAVNILAVQEINRMMQITRVPKSPPCVEGVINLRGRIIPVVDLRKRFGLPAIDYSGASRIVVVEVLGRVIGFTVDKVNEVLRIQSSIVENAPAVTTSVDTAYISGIGKLEDRLVILLDLDRLLDLDELRQVDSLKAAA